MNKGLKVAIITTIVVLLAVFVITMLSVSIKVIGNDELGIKYHKITKKIEEGRVYEEGRYTLAPVVNYGNVSGPGSKKHKSAQQLKITCLKTLEVQEIVKKFGNSPNQEEEEKEDNKEEEKKEVEEEEEEKPKKKAKKAQPEKKEKNTKPKKDEKPEKAKKAEKSEKEETQKKPKKAATKEVKEVKEGARKSSRLAKKEDEEDNTVVKDKKRKRESKKDIPEDLDSMKRSELQALCKKLPANVKNDDMKNSLKKL